MATEALAAALIEAVAETPALRCTMTGAAARTVRGTPAVVARVAVVLGAAACAGAATAARPVPASSAAVAREAVDAVREV
ncbi:MAG: hypothetical protein V9G10_01410 [Candidatus Nanopelagicales bacterium]